MTAMNDDILRRHVLLKYLFIPYHLVTLLAGFCAAQSVGAITSYQQTGHGIAGRAQGASFVVSVYSQHVIRVQVSRKNQPEQFSYALADNSLPKYKDFSIEDSGNRIVLKTDSLTIEVEKSPFFRTIFKDAQGNLLAEDVPGDGFGTRFAGNTVTVYQALRKGERFIGLGEELGNLDRRGSSVTLSNTDNYKYLSPTIPMYTSIPFFIGMHHRRMYGVFYHNSYRSVFNFGTANDRFSSYTFDGGDRDEFFIHDDSAAKILEHYTGLTGRMPLPPAWSLGYQQSRCSYYTEDEVMTVARDFREKKIPLDGIVLDADYLVHYEPFRIDTTRFPDMRGMANKLRAMNIELTASVNPGIRIDDSYEAHRSGLQQDIYLKYENGDLWVADIGPNTNHYPDFTSPKARLWWIEQMKVYHDASINGYWNDMNEPAVDGPLPDNLVFDFDGRKATSAEAHNYYGMLMARASFEAFQKYGGNSRPFVLSRAGFAGVQRYSAVWSGDNQARDEHIQLGALLNNQLGLVGVPFVGPDLGGYIGDGNKELFRRWIESGVFSPYLRNHREAYAAANEPWAYGEETETVARTYIRFRYRLMPYLYSEFREAGQTGMPISRCLCIDFPFDDAVYAHNNQYEFLFGDALLVNPMTSKETTKTTHLPEGEWYDLFSDKKVAGGAEFTANYPTYRIPIFVKASSVIPAQSQVYSTKENPSDTLYVHVYYGQEKHRFVYYEDDGQTLDYQRGIYYERNIDFDPSDGKIVFSKPKGNGPTHFKKIELVLHGFDKQLSFRRNGSPLEVRTQVSPILDPLADLEFLLDPQEFHEMHTREQAEWQEVKVIDMDNSADIEVAWH